jgi:hypothetical protein
MNLEKFGIYSKERKKELSELKKISEINQEDNRLKDNHAFYNNYKNDFSVSLDVDSDKILEVFKNRVKRKQEEIKINEDSFDGYIKLGRLSDNLNFLDEFKELLSDGNNVSRYKNDDETIKLTNHLIKEVYEDVQFIRSLNPQQFKKMENFFSKTNPILQSVDEVTEQYTLDLISIVLRNYAPPVETSKKDDNDGYYIKRVRVNSDLPKTVSTYTLESSVYDKNKSYIGKELSISHIIRPEFQSYDRYHSGSYTIPGRNYLSLNFKSDGYYETTHNKEDRKLIESLAIADLINIKKEFAEGSFFTDLPTVITAEIRPKLAVRMLSMFPNATIYFMGRIETGRKALKLLEIASKTGEVVSMHIETQDLINNQSLDSMIKEVSEVIRNREK